jgi:hypothetical protein
MSYFAIQHALTIAIEALATTPLLVMAIGLTLAIHGEPQVFTPAVEAAPVAPAAPSVVLSQGWAAIGEEFDRIANQVMVVVTDEPAAICEAPTPWAELSLTALRKQAKAMGVKGVSKADRATVISALMTADTSIAA